MKIFIKLLSLSVFLILLNSCAKPTVVDVVVPGDNNLSCEELKIAVEETEELKKDAEYAKEGTGGNVARMLVFWPAWAKSLHNADQAIMAADDRTFHLIKIMEKKKCPDVVSFKDQIKNINYKNSISSQLMELRKMYHDGDLTAEEYSKAKKKLLE